MTREEKNAKNRAYYARKGHKKRREYNLRGNYGITLDHYDAMVFLQHGECAICGGPPGKQRFHVDHDHKTGDVRALLCHKCNVGLGSFQDSPEILERAIKYLRLFSK